MPHSIRCVAFFLTLFEMASIDSEVWFCKSVEKLIPNTAMLILHKDVKQVIKVMPDKAHILAFLKKLERYPATVGDHYELDTKGNPIQFKVLKRHVLSYFRDPFAEETRVLSLYHVEKV